MARVWLPLLLPQSDSSGLHSFPIPVRSWSVQMAGSHPSVCEMSPSHLKSVYNHGLQSYLNLAILVTAAFIVSGAMAIGAWSG